MPVYRGASLSAPSFCSKIMALLNWAVKVRSWNCEYERWKWPGAFGQTQGLDRTCFLNYILESYMTLLCIAIRDQSKVPNHILICDKYIVF